MERLIEKFRADRPYLSPEAFFGLIAARFYIMYGRFTETMRARFGNMDENQQDVALESMNQELIIEHHE